MSFSKLNFLSLFAGKISIMKLVFSGRKIWVLLVIIFQAQIVEDHQHNYELFQGQFLTKRILDHVLLKETCIIRNKI